MANSKTYRIDPNNFQATALDGTAELPADKDATFYTKAIQNANQRGGYEVVDTTATSLAVDVYESKLTISGTMTATLPDGTFVGQRKLVTVTSGASIPALTLTVTTPETLAGFVCPATFLLAVAGQNIEFEWASTGKWRCISMNRYAGGSPVYTANAIAAPGAIDPNRRFHTLAVDGTDAFTLADGSYIGQLVTCFALAGTNIPVGTITPATPLGYATVSGIGALGDTVTFMWVGSGWVVIESNGCTFT